MVNTENMQKWIDALRSGQYQQIRGFLETTEGNCAMGVLCRVAIEAGVRMTVDPMCDLDIRCTAFDGAHLAAPRTVRAWLGLGPFECPVIGDDTIAALNDSYMVPFDDIADGLYRQYLKEPKTDG